MSERVSFSLVRLVPSLAFGFVWLAALAVEPQIGSLFLFPLLSFPLVVPRLGSVSLRLVFFCGFSELICNCVAWFWRGFELFTSCCFLNFSTADWSIAGGKGLA